VANFDQDVMRVPLVPDVGTEEAVGELAAVGDLARPRLDAAHVLEAADEQDAFALVVQQPLAGDIEALAGHADASVVLVH
jgi:hypothetical protein